MKICFDHAATVQLDVQAGDVLLTSRMTPKLRQVLDAVRIDNVKIAHLVEDDEIADARDTGAEQAVTGRGRRGPRAPHVS